MSDVTETTAWLNSISVWLMRLYSASHENTAMPIAQTPTCTHPHPPTHTHTYTYTMHIPTHMHTQTDIQTNNDDTFYIFITNQTYLCIISQEYFENTGMV